MISNPIFGLPFTQGFKFSTPFVLQTLSQALHISTLHFAFKINQQSQQELIQEQMAEIQPVNTLQFDGDHDSPVLSSLFQCNLKEEHVNPKIKQQEGSNYVKLEELNLEGPLTIKKQKENKIGQRRQFQGKKINRAELRFPKRRQRTNRKTKMIEKKEKSPALSLLSTDAHPSLGISMGELQKKREELEMRRVVNWKGGKPLTKLKRQMAYFFS